MVLIAAGILVALLLVLFGASQLFVPDSEHAGLPADGERGDLIGEIDVANVSHGRGIIELAVPVRVDGQLVWQSLPVIVRPQTWVRTSTGGVYAPAKLLPTRDSSVTGLATYLTDGTALRATVAREGNRLYVLKVLPVSVDIARAEADEVSSLGPVDFSGSMEIAGVVSGVGSDDEVANAISIEFNTPVSNDGLDTWLRIKAVVPDDAVVTLDGKALDFDAAREYGFERFDVLCNALDNEVVATFQLRDNRIEGTALSGTQEMYLGPYPGDNGFLEEEIGYY